MPIRSPRVRPLIFLAALCALGHVTSASAEDERWVRPYRGGEIGGYDRALDLVVHPSGEITVVGFSCNDLVVLRLDRTGQQLWMRVEPPDYEYAWRVSAVPSGEDVLVSAGYYLPYSGTSTYLYRYDQSGNTAWEQGTHPISAMVEDGAGGAILAGGTNSDLTPNYGVIQRVTADGQFSWSNFVPAGFPEKVLDGDLRVVAVQDSAYVYAAGFIHSINTFGQVIVKYDFAGQLQWATDVLPEDYRAAFSWLGPADDGTVAAAGVDSAGAWLARFGPKGEPLWMRRLPSLPVLATDPAGVVYTASQVPGQSDGNDILLTAIDPTGNDLWGVTYDSGTRDWPAAMTIDTDGTIVLLAGNDVQLVLLRYDPAGQQLSAVRLGLPPPSGVDYVLDLPGERAFVLGGVGEGTCCDASSDFFVAKYDPTALGPQVWAELDRPMAAGSSSASAVQVGGDGWVTTAMQSSYSCANALDLVHYESNGTPGWIRVHPEASLACFHSAGSSTVGCKRGESVQLARYDASGTLSWSHSYETVLDYKLDGLVADSDDGVLVMDVLDRNTTLITVDGTGAERWRRLLEGIAARAATVGPDGRVYLQSWTGSIEPRIHCLTPEGEVAWTRVLSGPERFVPKDLTAAEGGVFYITGYVYRAGANHWLTWRLGRDGSTQWIADEPAGSGNGNQPIRVRVHPAGGVLVAGTVTGTTSDGVLVRYDEQGEVQWRSGIDTPAAERTVDMVIDDAGNVLATMAVGIGSARTVKYDTNGGVVWSRDYSLGGGISYPRAIGVGPDLSVAVVGLAGGDSAFTIKYEDPTPVEISRLDAVRNGDEVLVSWEVGAGLEPLGFNVLWGAAPDRIKEQLNPDRLPADARSFVHHDAPAGDAYYLLEVLELDGGIFRHGPVSAAPAGAPAVFWATGPYPNPAWETVEWHVGLPAAARLRLAVHDALGRTVAEVVDQSVPAGEHHIPWDSRLASGARAPAGIYFYRLTAGAETRTGKLVLNPPR